LPRWRQKSAKVSGLLREYSRFGETLGGDRFDHDCLPILALRLCRFSGCNHAELGIFRLDCRTRAAVAECDVPQATQKRTPRRKDEGLSVFGLLTRCSQRNRTPEWRWTVLRASIRKAKRNEGSGSVIVVNVFELDETLLRDYESLSAPSPRFEHLTSVFRSKKSMPATDFGPSRL